MRLVYLTLEVSQLQFCFSSSFLIKTNVEYNRKHRAWVLVAVFSGLVTVVTVFPSMLLYIIPLPSYETVVNHFL